LVEINNPLIEEYVKNLIKVDDVILEMEELAKQLNFPIVDRIVGKFLYFLAKLKNPKIVVEIGSGFGYSAYWFAKGITDGSVVLTDYKFENLNLAEEFFRKGKLLDKVVFRMGDGIEIAKEYNEIDILFLDLEKGRYLDAVKTLEINMAPNGIIVADNVLWHGKVVEDDIDKKTEKIKEFTEYMFDNFDTTILPIRDGILLSFVR
jgi:predicted O-methyltransferase YrrM